jgi:hypothetical protein
LLKLAQRRVDRRKAIIAGVRHLIHGAVYGVDQLPRFVRGDCGVLVMVTTPSVHPVHQLNRIYSIPPSSQLPMTW